jgi:lipopolysaccharide transport system permease protein
MLFLLLGNHIALTPALLLIPIWLLLISMLALGVGLFFGALMVSYRDVQYVVPVLIGLLNFASPVAYPVSFVLSKLSSGVHPLYFLLNPLAALLSAFRWSLLGQGDVEWRYVVFSAGVSVVVFFIGAYAFKSLEGRLADVI